MYLVVVSDRVACTCAGDSKRVEEFCRGRNAKKLIPRGLLCRGGAALVTPPTIRADYSKLSGKLRRCATPPSSGANQPNIARARHHPHPRSPQRVPTQHVHPLARSGVSRRPPPSCISGSKKVATTLPNRFRVSFPPRTANQCPVSRVLLPKSGV